MESQNDVPVLFPNPANGQVMLSYKASVDEVVDIAIVDVVGRVVFSQQWEMREGSNLLTLDVRHMADGFYNVRVAGRSLQFVIAR